MYKRQDQYGSYLRMATEASLERIGADSFDLLLLHNPDRVGYSSEVVWDGMAALREAGLTARIGVAPGPANGFTLDLIACLERFGDQIDSAMLILNPLEHCPREHSLDAPARHQVKVHTRVYKQDNTLVAEFKRTVLIPKRPTGDAATAEGDVD